MQSVKTQVPGTVWSIDVAVGDRVEAGQPLLTLESMKMEIPIEADDTGTVAEILCQPGESVAEGQILVIVE